MGELIRFIRDENRGTITAHAREANLDQLVDQFLSTLHSPHTRRAYGRYLRQFAATGLTLNSTNVEIFVSGLPSPSVQSMAFSAIKQLALFGERTTRLGSGTARAIQAVPPPPTHIGLRHGNWLTLDRARQLIALPDRNSYIGMRDAALLALLLGCGLRRAEAVSVTWAQYQSRDNRMALVDLRGKGGRIRTVPVPSWAQRDLDQWQAEVESRRSKGGCGGLVPHYYAVNNLRTMRIIPLSENGVFYIVGRYAQRLGIAISPHDLRRTLAKLMRQSHVELEQIQFTLGHARLETTERYLGGKLELEPGRAGVDRTGL